MLNKSSQNQIHIQHSRAYKLVFIPFAGIIHFTFDGFLRNKQVVEPDFKYPVGYGNLALFFFQEAKHGTDGNQFRPKIIRNTFPAEQDIIKKVFQSLVVFHLLRHIFKQGVGFPYQTVYCIQYSCMGPGILSAVPGILLIQELADAGNQVRIS